MNSARPVQTPEGLAELLQIMARLRDPDGGCPWDLEQYLAGRKEGTRLVCSP